MKSRFSLLIFNILTSLFAGEIIPVNGLISFKVTPLNLLGKNSEIEICGGASSKTPLYVKVLLINDLYETGVEIVNYTFTSSGIKRFSYSNEYTRDKNTIKVTWQVKGSAETNTASHLIGVVSSSTYRITDESYFYRSKNNGIQYTPSSGWESIKQAITFKEFQELYMPDYYHKLDLSVFRITDSATFPSTLTCSSGLLSVTNLNGIFDNIATGNKIYLPITLNKEKSDYSLKFSNILYVNPVTLLMSSTPKDGFVETKYLYFPRNEKNKEMNYNLEIALSGVGFEYNNFIYSFRYKSILNILGDCHNSQYCVVNK